MTAKLTYRYEALATDGRLVSGTIDAADEAEGRLQLRQLSLSTRLFEPVVPLRTTPLNADDLSAFNDQLAQLARAGLPVEQGLKLLASDMTRGRLKNAVTAVTRELDAGRSLPEAIDAHRSAFPPLYANVIEAGIRVNNLPAVLFNLSKHLDLTRRIRASISRAIAYPTVVLLAIVIVSAFLSAYVLPSMVQVFQSTRLQTGNFYLMSGSGRAAPPPPGVPVITVIAMTFGRVAPFVAGGVVLLVVTWISLWPIVRGTAAGRTFSDSVLARLPLIGPPLRLSTVGRWCDALRIGISAGLDLPSSILLASQTVGSPRLMVDGTTLANAAAAGGRLDEARPLALLPAAVPAAIEISVRSGALPETLDALSTLYLRQAESRARLIPLILTPLLVLLLAVVLGGMLAAMFSPIVRLLQTLTG